MPLETYLAIADIYAAVRPS